MKFKAMHHHRQEYSIEWMCRVFDVSKSRYYEWLKALAKRDQREQQEKRLVKAIEAIHIGSKRNFGSPRITDHHGGLGHPESKRTVARRMKKHALND